MKFEKYADEYLESARRQGMSGGTIRMKKYRLKGFLGWLEEARPGINSLAEIGKNEMIEYHGRLNQEEGLKMCTVAQKLIVVRMFFRYLYKTEHILSNPGIWLELPKVPESLPRVILNEAETMRLLLAVDTRTPEGMRDRTILEMFYATGIRISELRDLNVEDVLYEEGMIRINKGKGGKDRVVAIGEKSMELLKEYKRGARPYLIGKNGNEKAFFVGIKGKRMMNIIVNEMILKYSRQAGIPRHVTAHIFRHTCATHMLRGGGNIRYVQEQLGHKSLSATQRYLRVNIEDLKKEHRRCHPIG